MDFDLVGSDEFVALSERIMRDPVLDTFARAKCLAFPDFTSLAADFFDDERPF